MSLTKVTYSMIQSMPANVLDFGADSTGVSDSTAAFTAALAASQQVYAPAGTYKISDTLYFSTQQIFGAGSGPDGTILSVVGGTNVPIFEYNGAYEYDCKISGFFIDYGDAVPSSGTTKIGINIPDVSAWPAFYEFSNIRIRGAHIAINDEAASWHGKYFQVWAEKCRLGFRKVAGTDIVYEQCYAHSGYQAWDVDDTVGIALICCAFDNNTDPDAVPIFRMTNVTGLVLDGMDQETNEITANGNAMMKLAYCNGFRISGIGIVGNKLSAATGENYWMQITNTSIGEISGINTASLAYAKAGGGTTAYIISVGGSASVAIKGSNLAEIVQTTVPSATRSVGNSGTGVVTMEATRFVDQADRVSNMVSNASNALALVAATPVNVAYCNLPGTYLVTVYANDGNNTIYQSVSLVVNDGTLATITALKAGTNLVLSLSGTLVQATCTGTTTGSFTVMRLSA